MAGSGDECDKSEASQYGRKIAVSTPVVVIKLLLIGQYQQ